MKKIKIIIPAGGVGKRFHETEFKRLKPFIKYQNKTIFEHILDSLYSNRYIVEFFIIIQEQFKNEYIDDIEKIQKNYNCKFKYINLLSEGTTCTSLFLYDELNSNDFVILMNCDQLIDITLDEYIDEHLKRGADGSLLCFISNESNKWSFVIEENDIVKKVVAKNNVSNIVVCGWYAWTKGSDFIKYAIKQIINLDKVNGEYYLCPIYNYAINDNKKIVAIKVSKSKMHGLGTPEDLRDYLSLINKDFS